MTTDPLLPPDGDYPTDEIDVWPMLAADAPAEAFVVDDNGATHDKRNGRFTKKAKRRPTFVRNGMALRRFTWEEVAANPDMADGPNVFEYPDEPGVEWETETFANGAVSSCRPVGVSMHVRVSPVKSRHVVTAETADPARVRIWARRNGLTVSDRGRIPARVMRAYLSQNEGR